MLNNVRPYQMGHTIALPGLKQNLTNWTQDSDPFELGPIIDAISREGRRQKRRIEEVEEEIEGMGTDDTCIPNKRAFILLRRRRPAVMGLHGRHENIMLELSRNLGFLDS